MDEEEDIECIYIPTGAQKGVLYQSLLSSDSAVYQTQIRLDVCGDVCTELIGESLQQVVDRHQSLRGLVLHDGLDEAAIVVRKKVSLPCSIVDWQHIESHQQVVKLDNMAAQRMLTPLQLDQAPMARVALVKLDANRVHLILDIHHILFDGWSNVIFFQDFVACYDGLLKGYEPALPVPGRFSDYAQSAASLAKKTAEKFWSDMLSGVAGPTPLPLSRPSSVGAVANSNYRSDLPADLSERLSSVATECRVTLNTLITAAWALNLLLYNDVDEVIVGLAVNGRSTALDSHSHTFGMFVNTLPARIGSPGNQPLDAWLATVQSVLIGVAEHDTTSLADVQRFCDWPSGVPMFDALLVFQSFDKPQACADPAIVLEPVAVHENSPMPLIVEVFDNKLISILAMSIEEQLPGHAVRQLIEHFVDVLSMFAQPSSAAQPLNLKQLPFRQQSLELSRARHTDKFPVTGKWGEHHSLIDLFFNQVDLTPHKVAIAGPDRQVSYQQLAEACANVARWFHEHPVRAGDRIGLLLSRNTAMYPALLAMIQQKVLFVPLDTRWPGDRLRQISRDAGLLYVITDEAHLPQAKELGTQHVLLEFGALHLPLESSQDAPEHSAPLATRNAVPDAVSQALYLMYTSGSTGVPKGVVGSEQATLNRFHWMWDTYPFHDGEVCLQKTPLCFVDSVWELFGPLLQGVPIHIVPDDIRDSASSLADYICEVGATRLVLVPSLLTLLLEEVADAGTKLASLRFCTVSGEELSATLASRFKQLLPDCRLLNLYGSTEVSGDVTCFDFSTDQMTERVSVGQAISGCCVYILDRNLLPLPVGAIGEVCVGGAGVALGYHSGGGSVAGDLSENFCSDPFASGQLFKTGDLGYIDTEGYVFLQGRNDDSGKIAGQKISTVEISGALETFAGVQIAFALVVENKLHAWYVSKDNGVVCLPSLMQHLRAQLPPYMVPHRLSQVHHLPRLATGKIDIKALPLVAEPELADAVPAIMDPIQTRLAKIWAEVLDGRMPGVHDHFLESGGSSFDAMRFNAKVHKEFGQSIPQRMFLIADFEQLANSLSDKKETLDELPRGDMVQGLPVLFPSGDEVLYGVFHQPVQQSGDVAVLLCSSLAHEYMKVHRTYRSLAEKLARQGYSVLRFDYSGFGNSSNETENCSVNQWLLDVRSAADELLDRSGCKSVCLVGARMGALLMLAADVRAKSRVVAWDPVFSGAAFTAHLDALHDYAMSDLDRFRTKQRDADPWERFGYQFSERLWSELQGLEIDNPELADPDEFHVLRSESTRVSDEAAPAAFSLANASLPDPVTTPSARSYWSDFASAQFIIIDPAQEDQLLQLICAP